MDCGLRSAVAGVHVAGCSQGSVATLEFFSSAGAASQTRQLDLYPGGDVVRDGRVDPDTLAGTWKGGVGGAVHDFYPHSANETNYIQQWVKQNSRLGIPVLFIEECLHGLQQAGHTVFPQAVALGASWDTDMVHRVGKAIGAEARACGIGMCLSPVLGVGY